MLTTVSAGRVFDFSHAVGGLEMPQPIASACGSGDTVYVLSRQFEENLDVPWHRAANYAEVDVFSMPNTPGGEVFLGTFGRYGKGEGELIWPVGIALDSEENIYIADEWMNRISIFSNAGVFLGWWGAAGSDDGEFDRPSGISIDYNDDVYVVDGMNHRVQKFRMNGEYVSQLGRCGDGDGELNAPWGITLDREGCVYVADHKNHRVQKFDAYGDFVMSFGSYGKGRGQLNRPSDVAVDPDGDVYVCDWGNDRVQVFAPDGKFIASLIGDAQQMARGHQEQVDANPDVIKARRRAYSLEPEWRFAMPTGVTFDVENSRLIVADTQRSRVQIYNKVDDYMEAQFNL